MAIDARKNFALGTIAVAPSPAVSGLVLTLTAGQGALMPASAFNATCWPPGVMPTKANAEIVRVESIGGDVVTLSARGQEETTAKAIGAGWQFGDMLTAKTIEDLKVALEAETTRAEAAEGTLTTNLAAEVSARTTSVAAAIATAEAASDTAGTAAADVAVERSRAETAEAGKASTAALASEGTARELGDATLASAITAETTRATAAEATKASSAALASETSAREAADSTNATAIASETTRAKAGESAAQTGAEGAATSKVSTEETRAKAAEKKAREEAEAASDKAGAAATAQAAAEAASIPLIQKGKASGVATLDGETHLTAAQVPPSVVSGSALGATSVQKTQITILAPSGGDDSAALVAALSTNCNIILGAGTFLWEKEVPKLPRNATGIRIQGMGEGVTTIRLSEAAPRFLDFNKIADYDTFQNIEISDLTIDCNNIAGTHHTVLGIAQAGVNQYLLNFNNIAIRRVQTKNVPSCQTLGSVVTTVNNRSNVLLASWHHGYIGSDTETQVTNILLEDCDFKGGNIGAAVVGSGGQSEATQPTALKGTPSATGGTLPANTYYYRVVTFDSLGRPSPVTKEIEVTTTGSTGKVVLEWTAGEHSTGKYQVWRGTEYGRENVYFETEAATYEDKGEAAVKTGRMPIGVNAFIDNVIFNRCRWTGLGLLTEYAKQEGFQIGSLGFGGRYEIKDCYAYGSGDNCFEVDGHSYALLDNCLADGIGGEAIDGYTLAGFSTPLDQQETVYRNCRARMAEAASGNPRGWGINAIDSASSTVGAYVGPVTFQGCRLYDPSSTWGANGRLIRVNGDLPLLKLFDTRLSAPNKTVALGKNVNEWLLSWVGQTENNRVRLVIRDLFIDIQGSIKAEGHAETKSPLLLETNTFELDIDNLVVTMDLPGSSTHSYEGIALPNVTGGTILAPSIIRRYKPTIVGDIGAYGLALGDSTHLSITDKLVLEDCDFTGLGSNSELHFVEPNSNAAKVFLVRPRMHAGFPAERKVLTVNAWSEKVWKVGEIVTSAELVYVCIKETEANGNKPAEATHWALGYQNLLGYPILFVVEGGETVTLEYQTGEAHYVKLGVAAGPFRMDNGDTMKIKCKAAPTLTAIPLNK